MNKLSILLSFFIVFSLACKKPPIPVKSDKEKDGKEDSTGTKTSPYVGTWSYDKIEMTNGQLLLQGQAFGTFDGTGKEIVGSIVVSENPNRFEAVLAYTAALNLTIFGQVQQSDFPVDERTLEGSWTESNGKINLIADDGTKITVVSSSSSQIVFQGTFNEQVPLGQQFSLDATSDVEFTVSK
jgi:hypothetical protein